MLKCRASKNNTGPSSQAAKEANFAFQLGHQIPDQRRSKTAARCLTFWSKANAIIDDRHFYPFRRWNPATENINPAASAFGNACFKLLVMSSFAINPSGIAVRNVALTSCFVVARTPGRMSWWHATYSHCPSEGCDVAVEEPDGNGLLDIGRTFPGGLHRPQVWHFDSAVVAYGQDASLLLSWQPDNDALAGGEQFLAALRGWGGQPVVGWGLDGWLCPHLSHWRMLHRLACPV
jgi:hypothetical protein